MIDVARFMSRVRFDTSSGCWMWTHRIHKRYPFYSAKQAHRVSYETFVGPIPDDYQVDHLCGQPLCVNPAHLEPVTRAENIRRRYASQTHCKRDHEFTPENTRMRSGRRVCRACDAIRHRALKERNREQVTS